MDAFGEISAQDTGDGDLVAWVRSLPLSQLMGKPSVHLGTDFADGIMIAEIIRYYTPHDIHIQEFYGPFNKGLKNWQMINRSLGGLCPVWDPR